MKLTATTKNRAGLVPLAARVLNDPGVNAAIALAGERPPLGTYNLAFRDAADSIIRVLDAIVPLYTMKHDEIAEVLAPGCEALGATENALHQLTGYFDRLEGILRRFVEPAGKKVVNKAATDLKNTFKVHRDAVALPINRVKHEGCNLNPIAYFHPLAHPGWFVEGFAGDSVAPDPQVHDQVLAFSYARTLRAWVVGMLEGSWALGQAILEHVKIDEASLALPDGVDTTFMDVLRRVSRLPFVFFPDEVALQTPCVDFTERGEHLTLKFGMDAASTVRRTFLEKKTNVYQAVRADGVTKKFTMAHRG